MYYTSPIINGKPYYVPIVAKNKDFIIGYINAISDIKELLFDTLESINTDLDFDFDLDIVNIMLNSSRFNDILENGKHESEMSEVEFKKYIYDIIRDASNKMTSQHNIENNIKYNHILDVECSCGLGYYAWDTYDSIPDTTFKCTNCGKILIHYTGHSINEYEFQEGEVNDKQKN